MTTDSYTPTPAEARQHLRRWVNGRRRNTPALGPLPWQVVAVEQVLDDLERAEEQVRRMVVTDLEAWTESDAADNAA